MTDVADLLARAEAALADLPPEAGAVTALVEGIPCASYPLDQPWATQAKVMTPPRPAALDAAFAWLDAQAAGPGRWTVTTRGRFVPESVFAARGLVPWLELPVLLLGRVAMLRTVPRMRGFELAAPSDAAEFLAVYGAELAPLVPSSILGARGYHHLVGRIDGEPVACALVREVADTAYISAVTVAPEWRGRGAGVAISAGAARLALSLNVRAVWLSAVSDLHPLYGRLGFRPVDTHVLLRRR